MSLSLLLQQCPACLVRLTRIVCEIEGWWSYSCFIVGCCFHDLFARSILVHLPSSLFSMRLVRVQVVQTYSSTDMTTVWKNCRFSLSVRSDFHITDNLFVADHAFLIRVLISLSVDEILLPRYVSCSTGFRGLPSIVEMSPFFLKLMNHTNKTG